MAGLGALALALSGWAGLAGSLGVSWGANARANRQFEREKAGSDTSARWPQDGPRMASISLGAYRIRKTPYSVVPPLFGEK